MSKLIVRKKLPFVFGRMDIPRYAVEVSLDFLYPTWHYSSASTLEFFMEELNVTRLVVLSAAATFESVIL